MDDKLVTLAEFATLFEAEDTKNLLLESDIKAMVVGDDLKDLLPVGGMTNVQVKVFECDLEKAKVILEQQTTDDSEES